ncbi:MAG: DUF169 domain-containing protein [Coriobacteriales bacterium]|jgi:uncharacterized protein (DUF169 family)/NAD-dependent dihydropyrimidine dehydrogenase PreA subunit|nr:DUF169 domain-containing protein [Coriobacteriales bacterium]
MTTLSAVRYLIEVDAERCTGCGLCAAFCPVEVFALDITALGAAPQGAPPTIVAAEACWGCETCAGQCPTGALRVIAGGAGAPAGAAGGAPAGASDHGAMQQDKAAPLPADRVALFADWATTLKDVLQLRWEPVAISLIPVGEALPDVPVPDERLRYCQSLMAARRGVSLMMPAARHACPDGTSILGLTEMPPKLASGELYLLFRKLHSIEAARRMVHERPCLPPRSIEATVVTPLAQAACEPHVVAVFVQPEQAMWLLMSSSYYTGHRHDLHASGYNAQCVETTLLPYQSGKINVSFGCYGCRAASDIGDDLMFVGIPTALMPEVVRGLVELGSKAIPQSRAKIYLPPMR